MTAVLFLAQILSAFGGLVVILHAVSPRKLEV